MKEIFEKIKERLEEAIHWETVIDEDGYAEDVGEVIYLDKAIEIVNQVAEEYSEVPEINVGKNDGWISVSERLPEEDDKYLCQTNMRYQFINTCYFAKNLSEVNKYYFYEIERSGFYDYDSEYGYYEIDDVIAWQPLPKPYQPKGETK